MTRDIVGIVKRQLWRNGVNAKDVSGAMLGVHLVANGKHRIRVVVERSRTKYDGVPEGAILAVVTPETVYYEEPTERGYARVDRPIHKLFEV